MTTRLPAALDNLLHELTRLPGIGRRGAERMAVHLLEAPADQVQALAQALTRMREEVKTCMICGNWSEGKICNICSDARRHSRQLCVVERPTDLWAFEQAEAYEGRYHILGGTLSPLSGVTAEDLRIDELERRIREEGAEEVILATNPSVEGDATAHYLAHRLAPLGIKTTRIAQGVPVGGHLGYSDSGTLRQALEGRRTMEG